MIPFNLTLIESTKPTTLTKMYRLDDAGQITHKTAANMVEGVAHNIELGSLDEFAEMLTGLESCNALAYGVTGHDKINLCTKKRFEEERPAGFIPRSDKYMHWPSGAGVMLLDYDPSKDGEALCRDELLACLAKAAPALADAGHVWFPSSSSHIFHNGDDLTGLRGQRVYLIVQDASDIPRAGKVLADRLWLAGYGKYEISRAGSLLERTIIDTSVWQTNRLDFAAGAFCAPPLEQRRGEPVVQHGPAIATREALPDLSPEEQSELTGIKQALRAELQDDQQAAKQLYIEDRLSELVGGGASEDVVNAARQTLIRAIEKSTLTGEFPIHLENGQTVTVGEILDNPAKYHGGKIYLYSSRPSLHSFAHGGRSFRLLRQLRRIEVVTGRRHDAVQMTVDIMRELPEVYDMGDLLVTVEDGQVHPLDNHRLAHWLGGAIQYYSLKSDPKTGLPIEVDRDPDQPTVNQILALKKSRKLKELDAVITAPTMRPDGSVLARPGYDKKTRLLLDLTEQVPYIAMQPSDDQVRDAVNSLMKPFESFPFCTDLDRGVFLAALLTAVVRPVLPTAPGFAFDAPVQGSGKTLLAKCLFAIAAPLKEHEQPKVMPHTAGRDDEEIRKRLMSALVNNPPCIVWDNVMGIFDSPSLAALLTSGSYTDRILGKSEQVTLPNKALFLMTGNNLSLAGDMPRRVIKCRIDPQTERPYARQFDFDPLQYVKQHRLELVSAALTIMRGWHEWSWLHTRADGRMASFEQWDDMVRQPVAWLSRHVMPGQFGDPMDAVDMSQTNDPEQEALHDLLSEIKRKMGSEPFPAKDLHKVAFDGFSSDDQCLADAITDISGRQPNSKSLGRILAHRKDRIVRGLVLRDAGTNRDKARLYQVVEIPA